MEVPVVEVVVSNHLPIVHQGLVVLTTAVMDIQAVVRNC
jgi:hypothetical protein